ncbi:hypothetical protein [Massilia aerilata]|uniref:Uncharacterized protein n=1 Tax=Massilia aerilata TaxID=453817 RepID=A0ABW0RXR3_9BURK
MARWLIRAGVFFLVLGLALLSPLADLLPVDLFSFMARRTGPVRIVPAEGDGGALGFAVLLFGLALLGAGLVARRR